MMHGQANINQEGKQKWPLFQKSIGSDYYRAICCLITVDHPFVAQVSSSSSFLSLLSIGTTFYFYKILHNIQQVAWQLWRKRMNWQSRNKFNGVLYSSSHLPGQQRMNISDLLVRRRRRGAFLSAIQTDGQSRPCRRSSLSCCCLPPLFESSRSCYFVSTTCSSLLPNRVDMPARVIGCKSTTRGGPAGRTLKWEQKEKKKKKFSREESQHCSKRQDPEQENAAAPRGWGPFFLFSLFSFLSFSDSLLLFHRLNRISQTEKKKEMEYFYRCASSLARLGSALPVAALNSSNCSEPLSWTTTPGPSLSLSLFSGYTSSCPGEIL